jgi:hypothetical protein
LKKELKFPKIEGSHPESDTSTLLSSEMATQYRAVIGSLNCVVILGRFGVMFATSTFAQFPMAPRLGHLEATKRVFGYLKKHPSYRILLNPNKIDISEAVENTQSLTIGKNFIPKREKRYLTGSRSQTRIRRYW